MMRGKKERGGETLGGDETEGVCEGNGRVTTDIEISDDRLSSLDQNVGEAKIAMEDSRGVEISNTLDDHAQHGALLFLRVVVGDPVLEGSVRDERHLDKTIEAHVCLLIEN